LLSGKRPRHLSSLDLAGLAEHGQQHRSRSRR
jgi:hypothetical protein